MSRLFRDSDGGCLCPRGSVVCIGAFDGLHLGHRALVSHVVARARALDVDAVALSFEPLPREFFARAGQPSRLLLPRMKFEGLRQFGVDVVGLLRFNRPMVAMSARAFVERVLVTRLGAREVWVGPQFRFGHAREGDLASLQALGQEFGFSAHAIEPVTLDGARVSSSRIRLQLGNGEIDAAAQALGRRYAISGKVVYGRQLGRTLGFPTANLRLAGKKPALTGIFATRVHGIPLSAGDPSIGWPSVSSLGTRPTVHGSEPLLEAHLFDFDGDLYGRRIEIEFVAKLRDEEKFDDLPALAAQMHRDAEQARQILQTHSNFERISA